MYSLKVFKNVTETLVFFNMQRSLHDSCFYFLNVHSFVFHNKINIVLRELMNECWQ